MIVIKSPKDIEKMRASGRIAGLALKAGGEACVPGATTADVCSTVEKFLRKQGAKPTFQGYEGFPAAACISVNEEVIHGIPGKRKLREGDIVSIDVGATYDGFVGDTAKTFAVGEISEEQKRLIYVTKQAFFAGLAQVKPKNRIADISRAVQNYVESNNFGVVKEYIGHGVGRKLHEDPEIPNFIDETMKRTPRLLPGMTICIEPMVTFGDGKTILLKDGWTVVSENRKPSAHYEHTILVTDGEPELLTLVNE